MLKCNTVKCGVTRSLSDVTAESRSLLHYTQQPKHDLFDNRMVFRWIAGENTYKTEESSFPQYCYITENTNH